MWLAIVPVLFWARAILKPFEVLGNIRFTLRLHFVPLPSSLYFLTLSLISFFSVFSCLWRTAVIRMRNTLVAQSLSFILPDKQLCTKYLLALFAESMSFSLAFIFYQLVFLPVSLSVSVYLNSFFFLFVEHASYRWFMWFVQGFSVFSNY